MRRLVIRSAVVLATFVLGVVIAWTWAGTDNDSTAYPESEDQFVESITTGKPAFVAEFSGLTDLEEIVYPEWEPNLLDLWETDDSISEFEYTIKRGEKWLVLTKKGDRYSFVRARTRPSKVKAEDGSSTGHIATDFKVDGIPVIAAKNIRNLNPGNVSIVYHRPPLREIPDESRNASSLKPGDFREYLLGEVTWRLRVTTGLTASGEKVVVLVLGDGNSESIVYYSGFWAELGIDIGDVLLAGDLDNDGKLDLYLESTRLEESQSNYLYLSSHAETNRHVRYVAGFSFGGC